MTFMTENFDKIKEIIHAHKLYASRRYKDGNFQKVMREYAEWYAKKLLEEQKVKTGLAMLNLFEYMVRNTSDINWKQNLLSQIKDRQDELNTTITDNS